MRRTDPLLKRIGDAKYVLLGEASHGTSEFYGWRTEITKRLVSEKGFSFIAVEGDWPDCYKVNDYVKQISHAGPSIFGVLQTFSRWPTWMWANREIIELVDWLRRYNENKKDGRKVGFFGLDVYSLWESLDAVLRYIKKNYPDSLDAAIRAYNCFEPFGRDAEEYAKATAFIPQSCEDEVVEMLRDLRKNARTRTDRSKTDNQEEAYFNAEQNAAVTKNAELYYRTMLKGGSESWNIRDGHMMSTLESLMKFHGSDSKCIVWAHNTHIGDARATDMRKARMVNLGQLAREQAGRGNVVLVGFGTYEGTVIAAKEWDGRVERMKVPPAIDKSWDSLLHKKCRDEQPAGDKLFIFAEEERTSLPLFPMGQRAIGVVYNPSYEKYTNYTETDLPERYDALLFVDKTNALHPVHMPISPDPDVPETFPTRI